MLSDILGGRSTLDVASLHGALGAVEVGKAQSGSVAFDRAYNGDGGLASPCRSARLVWL
eukprot:CAMPEP_0177617740 /NCGR_PEP_ID=MMETSP0419_2-20121207/25103_1 /TAXON_ID=582737 /ORGANISM="Tetraselmis sp., Strain GSL018" /LENGTH=58 /DNA_ID=CAMNT_0019116391 /DNA_START=1085 /DNA_END=1261 /DNA_ORIENTATION=-